MTQIRVAQSDDEILRCFPAMVQLRTQLKKTGFLARIRLQECGGYRLAYAAANNQVRSVAGFRIIENLSGGRVLYVDDLVTQASKRSKGHGQELFNWLVAEARTRACNALELDSGVQRFKAHRFYLRNQMVISSHHFLLRLKT